MKSKLVFSKICVIVFSLPFLFSGCKADETAKKGDLFVMSTYVTQQVYGKNADVAIQAVNEQLKTLEAEFSLYKDNSDIDKINKSAGLAAVKVNDYTFELINTALEYSEQSSGVFDITIAPLTTLWGVHSENPKVPTNDEIIEALKLVDYKKVILNSDEMTVFLQEQGMALDLGGIAKGYFCGKIKEIYEKNNVSSALCSIGGNILTYKTKPNGESFTLGIRDPLDEDGGLLGTLASTDEVVATTGGYERYFEYDGKKYHHILDTKTGLPSDNDILSVSVISKDGGLADFLSTTLFVAGTENIEKYLNNENFSVIVVDKDKKVYLSDNIKDCFTLTNDTFKIKEWS